MTLYNIGAWLSIWFLSKFSFMLITCFLVGSSRTSILLRTIMGRMIFLYSLLSKAYTSTSVAIFQINENKELYCACSIIFLVCCQLKGLLCLPIEISQYDKAAPKTAVACCSNTHWRCWNFCQSLLPSLFATHPFLPELFWFYSTSWLSIWMFRLQRYKNTM